MSSYAHLSTLQLYRRILKAAKLFPSVKKEKILTEIKTEFRANKHVNSRDKLDHHRAVAERGLSDLEAYISANGSESFSLHLKGATK